MAYLPDQTVYGPSWQRVLMVDLAGVAGAIFATTIEICTRTSGSTSIHCADQDPNDRIRPGSTTARLATRLQAPGSSLTGWLLTMNYDHNNEAALHRRCFAHSAARRGARAIAVRHGRASARSGFAGSVLSLPVARRGRDILARVKR